MKSIAVAGKGGTGKSTIAALIIAALIQRGETPVLAIDADADANLTPLLGAEKGTTVGDLREDFLADVSNFPAGMSKAAYIEAGLHDIIVENRGFDVLTMGRGEGPGCYCYLNSLIQKFSGDLMPSYTWVVMDNEAGLEHVSRRTSTHLDGLIVVVTDNPLSMHSAAAIKKVAEEIKNPVFKIYAVTNMVREDRKKDVIEKIHEIPMDHICDIPADPELEETVYRGETLLDFTGKGVMGPIENIINKIGGNNGTT